MAYEKRFAVTEKFFNKPSSNALTDKELYKLVVVPLKERMDEISFLNKKIFTMIGWLDADDEKKLKLRNYLKIEPIFKVLSEQPKAIKELIDAIKSLDE